MLHQVEYTSKGAGICYEIAAMHRAASAQYGQQTAKDTATSQSRRTLAPLQLDDRFGSPSTADVETFARAFDAELDAALGAFADELEREVSSPV